MRNLFVNVWPFSILQEYFSFGKNPSNWAMAHAVQQKQKVENEDESLSVPSEPFL